MSKSDTIRRAIVAGVVGAVLLGIAFCGTGCGIGSHYVHRSYHPNGQLASEEKRRDWTDTNLGRIDLDKVPRGQEFQLPPPPTGGSVAGALESGHRLFAQTTDGRQMGGPR